MVDEQGKALAEYEHVQKVIVQALQLLPIWRVELGNDEGALAARTTEFVNTLLVGVMSPCTDACLAQYMIDHNYTRYLACRAACGG
jgi:hypothetical protein